MRKHTDTCRHGSYVSVGRLKVNKMDKWTREYASDKFHRTIKEEKRGKRQERGDIGGPCFKTQGTWGCSMRFVLHKAFVKWANIPAVWSEVSRVGQAGKGVQNIIFACFLRSKISFLVWWKVDWPYLSMGSGRNSWEEGRPGTGRGGVEEASYLFRRNARPAWNCEAAQNPKPCLPGFSALHLSSPFCVRWRFCSGNLY